MRSRRGVQDGSHGTVLAVAEALLPLGGEDLWDRHPGAPADLGIGIGDLHTQRLGQKPGLGGLARAGQPHQDQRQLVVAQGDGWNALPGHDRVSLTVEQAIGTSIAFTDGITTRFTSVSAGLCGPGRPEGCAWPRQPSHHRSCPGEDRPEPRRSWPERSRRRGRRRTRRSAGGAR